jgi:hypothetical protein
MARRIVRAKDVPTFKIVLPRAEDEAEDTWVECRTMLRTVERDRLNSNLVATDINEETEEMRPRIDTSRANTMRLLAYLVDWGGPGFTDEAGKREPINEENVGSLDEETSTYILRMIRVRNPRPVAPKGPALAETSATNS